MNWMQDDPPALPELREYEVTYSPHHTPTGAPRDKGASRQVLQERRTAQLQALTAEGATDAFERETGHMVTNCARVQEAQ